ncbi:hypothetical protein BU15DRAFT_65565 [Melanogaster broomeanus]|nr:hypothetical protein BU15DRAFT_65565 [Melanogaster broomeanus]
MKIPPHWRLRMSDIIAEYMINQFLEAIGRPIRPTSLPDTSIPLSAVFEADRIVQSMAKAYQNQRSFPIDIRRMAESLGPNETGTNEQKEQSLKERFPLEEAKEMIIGSDPPIGPDRGCPGHGIFLASYLMSSRQALVLSFPFGMRECGTNLELLFPALSRSVSNSRSWRTEEELFGGSRDPNGSKPALCKPPSFRHRLFVMHPDFYASGRETLCKLGQSTQIEEMKSVLSEWSLVYSVTSVIVNWATPFHRDQNCRIQWLDMLASIGGDPDLHMELDTLGVGLSYGPGMVLALSGKVLRHGVPQLVTAGAAAHGPLLLPLHVGWLGNSTGMGNPHGSWVQILCGCGYGSRFWDPQEAHMAETRYHFWHVAYQKSDATSARAAPKMHRWGQNRQTGLVGLKANGLDQEQMGLQTGRWGQWHCKRMGEAINIWVALKMHGGSKTSRWGTESAWIGPKRADWGLVGLKTDRAMLEVQQSQRLSGEGQGAAWSHRQAVDNECEARDADEEAHQAEMLTNKTVAPLSVPLEGSKMVRQQAAMQEHTASVQNHHGCAGQHQDPEPQPQGTKPTALPLEGERDGSESGSDGTSTGAGAQSGAGPKPEMYTLDRHYNGLSMPHVDQREEPVLMDVDREAVPAEGLVKKRRVKKIDAPFTILGSGCPGEVQGTCTLPLSGST